MGWMWLLVLVLVIVAVIAKIRRNSHIFIIRQNNPFQQAQEQFRNTTSRQPPRYSTQNCSSHDAERMVCCELCEVYVPVSEAVERSGKVFCCQEHSKAYFSRKQA